MERSLQILLLLLLLPFLTQVTDCFDKTPYSADPGEMKVIPSTLPKSRKTRELSQMSGCGTRTPEGLDENEDISTKTCNHSKKRKPIFPTIVGGKPSDEHSWPWMVALFDDLTEESIFKCGASLITRWYVLTAAHCFDGEENLDPSKFSVVVGAHQATDGTSHAIDKIILHPEYNDDQVYNDIAVLRLKEEVKLGSKVYPVCLPSDDLSDTDIEKVTVTGWGDTSSGGEQSRFLQEVSMPIVPLEECNSSYSKANLIDIPQGITNVFICAGEREGGKDSCQGDSGGAMVTELKEDTWVQVGIVSFGFGCGEPGFPGVYTRISQYKKWLQENTDLD